MPIQKILSELNPSQNLAATYSKSNVLVLAGAGTGKTKTIIARAAYLISQWISPYKIQILTFTRRSASEIVDRVSNHLGEQSKGLKASTFHTWCAYLIRQAPSKFGFKNFTIIDRDDQVQLFRLIRGKQLSKDFPKAAKLCDLYSFSKNTNASLEDTLINKEPDYVQYIKEIEEITKSYEQKKLENNYLDYDDILNVVSKKINENEELCEWVGSKYDHILVDEMQDTNQLQWRLLEPMAKYVKLFCVGDDAQSIYGFRGADFHNVHSFKDRFPNSTVLKLEDNYRSTQEILDLSNWLLEQSSINYDKKLRAVRGSGKMPQIHTFANDWKEAQWLVEDLMKRKDKGALWKEHAILVRSGNSARIIEEKLITNDIPYVFIGGTKLLESAHIRDVLSLLRIIANNKDEIGWMRYLNLWPGIGEVTAGKIANNILKFNTLKESIEFLESSSKSPLELINVIKEISLFEGSVAQSISKTVSLMEELLSGIYKKDWDKRKKDFPLLEKLSEKHSSILEFLKEYILNPVFNTERDKKENSDVVSIITIHSAKGTEKEVCYVQYGANSYMSKTEEDIEEERRVLYVALTRAKNELIITRKQDMLNRYNNSFEFDYFNELPENLAEKKDHIIPQGILRNTNIFKKFPMR